MVIPGIEGHLQSVVVGTESIRGLSNVFEIRELGVERPRSLFSCSVGSATGRQSVARAKYDRLFAAPRTTAPSKCTEGSHPEPNAGSFRSTVWISFQP